jgi:hypothetical protein
VCVWNLPVASFCAGIHASDAHDGASAVEIGMHDAVHRHRRTERRSLLLMRGDIATAVSALHLSNSAGRSFVAAPHPGAPLDRVGSMT